MPGIGWDTSRLAVNLSDGFSQQGKPMMDACCVDDSLGNCTFCDDTCTPEVVWITISDITPCTSCISESGDGWKWENVSNVLGTYKMTRGPESCRWRNIQDTISSVTLKRYDATDCSGSPISTESFTTLWVAAEKTSSTTLEVGINLVSTGFIALHKWTYSALPAGIGFKSEDFTTTFTGCMNTPTITDTRDCTYEDPNGIIRHTMSSEISFHFTEYNI